MAQTLKTLPAMQEAGFDPWVRKIPWSRGNTLQNSCLGNPMDRGACRATICGVAKQSEVTEQLSTHAI